MDISPAMPSEQRGICLHIFVCRGRLYKFATNVIRSLIRRGFVLTFSDISVMTFKDNETMPWRHDGRRYQKELLKRDTCCLLKEETTFCFFFFSSRYNRGKVSCLQRNRLTTFHLRHTYSASACTCTGADPEFWEKKREGHTPSVKRWQGRREHVLECWRQFAGAGRILVPDPAPLHFANEMV